MHFLQNSIIVAGLLASLATAVPQDGGLFKRATCKQNNCYNAINKTGTAGAVRSADCTAAVRTTVTPCPSSTAKTTVTTTSTITSTILYGGAGSKPVRREAEEVELEARAAPICPSTQTPASTVPTYANACTSTAGAYISACSCIGVMSMVTTLAPTVYTPTSTVYTTSTLVANSPRFRIQFSDGTAPYPNIETAQLEANSADGSQIFHLEQGTNYLYDETSQPFGGTYFVGTANDGYGFAIGLTYQNKLVCHLQNPTLGSGALTCADSDGRNTWQECGYGRLYMTKTGDPLPTDGTCKVVTLTAVPA